MCLYRTYNQNRDNKNNANSLYLNAGVGIKYRLNDKIDIESRIVLNLNNEDHLDAAISHKQTYESFFTGNLGIVYKLGKKKKYAVWVQDEVFEPFVLIDRDNDGVVDDLDKEINTPKGAEVYGSGIAIDTDKDGLKDYEDSCPVVPGPVSNKGCPLQAPVVYNEPVVEFAEVVEPVVEFKEDVKKSIMDRINLLSKAIYFKTNSDQLKQESYEPLNKISEIMLEYPDSRFKIEGHTDSRGNDKYNLNLSKKRSKSVYSYLTKQNISSERLSSKGYGEVQPISTNDTETGRQQNRRVEINFIDPDSEEGKLVYPQGTVLRGSSNSSRNVRYSGGNQVAKDSDGDGVPDVYDKEANTPKQSRVYGDGVSIDSDMDGVPDFRDNCPFAKGPVERQGCPIGNQSVNNGVNTNTAVGLTNGPDADGDGIEDRFDNDQNTPSGVKVYSDGVAIDSDKDGVPDHLDKCPLTNGSLDKDGCPDDKDLDGDGVIDRNDRCPDVKGDIANYGCPAIKVTGNIEDELKKLGGKLKFSRSEGHVLKSNNLLILEKIGAILNQYKATSVNMEVHTNNKPNLRYNLDLSKRRAFAIKKYLTKVSGVESSRVDVKGLGGSKPKYDIENKTENIKNNRVELIVN